MKERSDPVVDVVSLLVVFPDLVLKIAAIRTTQVVIKTTAESIGIIPVFIARYRELVEDQNNDTTYGRNLRRVRSPIPTTVFTFYCNDHLYTRF